MPDVYRYRSDLSNPAHISPIALDVEPGEEFDSWEPLNHPHLTPLNKPAKDWALELARQDAEHKAAFEAQYGKLEEVPTPAPAAEAQKE